MDLLLLGGFCAYFFYFGLAAFGLVGADEPRYAQVAREMLARRDWVTPTLNGVAWLEKPVLYYWQAMLSYRVFGVSDWAARVPSAVDASLMVLAVYFFLRRFRSGFELDGALVTASMAATMGFARAAATDMPLAASFTAAMLAWYAWYERPARVYQLLFYAFIALGLLAKGPVAPFLAGAIIVCFAVAQGQWRLIWKTVSLPGILLLVAIAMPWYAAVQLRNPAFFRTFILEHNLARFGTNLYHHSQPFWYYVPVLLLGLVPWTVFVVAAIVDNGRTWAAGGLDSLRRERPLEVFLLLWLVVPVVFFSISESKLPGYILPAMPACSVLLAEYLRRKTGAGEAAHPAVTALHSVVAALPMIPALTISYLVLYRRLPWGRGTVIALAATTLVAAMIFWSVHIRYGLVSLRRATLVPVVVTIAAILRMGAPALDAKLSSRPLAIEIAGIDNRAMPVSVFRVSRELEYGLNFYRNQPIGRYEWGQVPAAQHIVVAPQGSQTEIAKRVPGRRVSYLETFAPQKVDFFWVASKDGRQD